MTKCITIESKRLLLRPFRLSYCNDILAYRGDPEIARYQLWEPFTRAKVRLFIQKYKVIPFGSPGRWSGLVMQLKQNESIIGDIALNVSRDVHPQAQIGYNVASAWQRKGFATEAVSAVLDWLFTNTQTHRVTATCDCKNKASAAVVKKLGFRQEAHFRRNSWSKGRWSDEYIFALLKDEWLKQ